MATLRIGVTGLLLVFSVVATHGQNADRIRMAKVYEQSGDLRSAARIYLELYEGGDRSSSMFDGVARTLVGLKQYASLLPIVEERFEASPSGGLASLAASLSARTGDPQAADEWWTKAIEVEGERESLYAMIGKDQKDLLMTTRAISSYENARRISGEPLTYARELAELYGAAGRPAEATREILLVYRLQNQLSVTYGQLSALMTSDEATQAIGRVLEEPHDSIPTILEIRSWFYRETGNWEQAFATVKELDEQTNQRGNSILRFGRNARTAGQYDIALRAYESLLDGPKQIALAAAYGYARTLDDQMSQTDQIQAEQARQIIDRYRLIIDSYRDHPLSADAAYRAAVLYDQVLNDQDGARGLLTGLINRWKGTQAAADGALLLAELFVVAERPDAATDLFRSLATSQNPNTKDQQDLAALWLADLELFDGQIQPARARYLGIVEDPRSIAANDAIERLSLLMMIQEDSIGVMEFVKGLYASRKRQYSEAARSFADAAAAAKSAEIRDRCHLEAAEMYVDLGRPLDADQHLEPIIARIPESIYGDRALVLAADLLVANGDTEGAIAALTTLLVQYPRSILAPDTRERIRQLRGDA